LAVVSALTHAPARRCCGGRRRFQRILRAFAAVLAFNELENTLGFQNEATRPEERCLTLFMLALWHA
jgi:hypothetical protein